MASVAAEEDDGGVPLDIDNVHMLLQVEHEQIQRRTFTNWINAQLSKRRPPSCVSDLFSDLRDGSRLLDLLEVMSGQTLKRQRGQGFFQQRANIESALDFLRKKNIKLVNINIPDIIDGRPSIVLGLVWTIILHCHIEELANALSFSSRHSSLDSLASLDSWSGSPVPVSPVPAGGTSPLHRRFRVSAKKALLMWVRDQCQKVGSSVSVKDFKSSWRSGEAFLAVLCSLRPQLVDLSLVQSRSHRENLEEAFHLAERELHIPRLLEPQDVDVKDPDDKSIMTYVAQFLQYSNDMPAPDDHLQLFPQDQPFCFSPVNVPAHSAPAMSASRWRQIPAGERAQEVTCWLQQTCQELSEARTTTGNSGCTEKHQLQGCRADLDLGLPPPLDSVVAWLQRAEAALTEEGGRVKDPADGAKEARAQQDTLKTLIKEMSHHVKILDDYHVADGSGNAVVSPEKFEEIKRRVTHIRVTTKYHGIKLEYQERRHTVLDLLNRVRAKIQTWTTSYRSKEAVLVLLQDWHETVERQDMLLILMDAVQNLKETADAYTGKAALGDDSQFVRRRVKEAEGEAESLSRAVAAARGTMDRVASAWDTYDRCLTSLQTWLAQTTQSQDMSEWTECQAKLNEAGNLLIEVTETSTGRLLAGQLGKVNKHWAECVKRTKFEIPGSPGFKERVGEPARRTHTQPETGPFVVARTKHAQQTGNFKLQAQGPGQLSPRTPLSRTSQRGARDPQGWPQHQRTNAQDGTTIVVPLVKIQMLPRPLTEPVLRFHSPLAQSVNDRESFSGSHAQALRQRDQPSPSSARTDVGPTARRSLPRSKHVTSSATEGNQSSPPSQTREPQSRTRAPPNPPQTDGTSPRPPVMVRGEVHSRARSMARSRLEKARVRLQGRIQQAMELFGGKEISESQAKKKQRALKTLQPVAPGEFLDAAEGFGAFCSGPQLRELTLLSDSVRKQWEDVCREMAAFVPDLWSLIGGGKQSFSVVQSETHTNAHRHEATDPTDRDCLLQQQDVVGGAGSAEDRVESLRELCETLTPSQSSCLATERREEADQAQETRPGDTVLPQRRGRQLGASAPLRATGTSSADARPSSSLPERRSSDVPQQDLSPADDSLPLRSAWDVPTERKDSVQKQKPSLRAKELLLKARLLHMEESNEQTQTHIQAVIRSSTVETKQAAEWTVIPDAVRPPPQEEQRSGQEVPERCRTSFLVFQPRLKKIDQHSEMKDEMRPVGAEQMQRSEVFVPVEKCATKTRDGSPRQVGTQEREHRPPSAAEEESGLEAKRCKLDGEHQAGTWKSDGDAEDQRRGRRQVKKEGEEKEKESSVQRRAALLGALREIRGAAEQLRLHELTLPALQQRTRALTELQSRHAGLLSELRRVRDASSSGHCDASRSGEVEGSWAETTKAVNERLEQCCVLTELLKRFQCVRAELSGTLQKAESTIGEHASYMGKENLHKLYAKVQGTKAELNGLGDGVEEVRGVCRQIHTHLRQMPESDVVPFESDADALMDSWLDISERTDSHLENSRLCLTLWDGVLQLGAQVEKWSADELAAFARSPRFQSEDDVRALQKEIVAQEENVECFQRRAAEIQSLLRSADPPLELQVAEAQMRKTLEQLKELVSEAEDVREQTEAARGQIAARIAGCFECLQNVQDSLVALGGSDVATVLAKLKDLCRRLQAQDERVESLLDDLRALSSVCGPDALQSLSAEALRLHDEVGNSRRLFSEVQEQTQRNARDLHRLQRESEHVEQWLQATEEKAARAEDLSLLSEEALNIRARTELLGQLVSSLRRSNLQRSALVDDSRRLLERYHLFHADAPRGSEEKRCSVGGDVEAFRPSSRSAESWVGDLGRPGDAPLGGSPRGQSPVEQTLHRARAVVSAAADGGARLEKLRVAGNGLSHGPRDGGDLKRENQDSVRKMEERRRILLQSDEPDHRPQEVRHRVGELQRQITGLPASFPWPGAAERRRACRLARQLWAESESLQITLGSLAGRRGVPAERTSDHDIWRDSSWDELDNCCVSLMAELKDACSRLEEGASNEEHFGQLLQDCHRKLTSLQDRTSACRAPRDGSAGPSTDVPALEALLHEVTDLEKDILQLEALKDSIADTSTAEAQASLSRQVGNLQSHKRALDGSIRGILAPLAANGNHRRVRQVKEEVSCVQAAVRGLADNVGNLFVNHEALADVSLIKQQWSAIQDFDCRLTDLAARVYGLQNIGESGITAEMLPADVLSTVDGVAEDFDSLRSIFLQNKQECEETTACVVRGVIGQLQRWSQMTVQAEPPSPSQATLEEGLQLQQYLREVLSDKDHLLNCLGTKVSKELEKDASDALGESARAPEASSKWPVSRGHGDVELDKRETAGETFGSDTSHSASPDETPAVCPPEPPALSATDQDNLDSVQNDNVITKGSRYTLDCVSVERADISVVCVPNSLMQTAKKDAVVSYPVPNPKIPDVLKSETRQEPRRLTSASPKIDSITDVKPNDDIANINTHSSHQNTGHRTTAGNASVLDSKPSALTMDNTQKISSSASGYLTAQSNASKGVADAQGVQERCENTSVTPKKVFTIVLDLEPHNMQDNKHVSTSEIPMNSKGAEMCDAKLTEGEVMGIPEEKSDLLTTLICPESDKMDSQNIGAQSETSKAFNDGQEKEKDTNASPNKVFTIVLELPVHQDVQQRVNVEASRCSQGAELCGAKPAAVSKSDLLSTLFAPEADDTDLKGRESNASRVADSPSEDADRVIAVSSSAQTSAEWQEVQSPSATLSETREPMPNVQSLSVAGCQLAGARAAEATFLSVKEEATDSRHSEKRTLSSDLCTAESPVRAGDASANRDTRTPAGDSEHAVGAGAAGEGRAESAAGEARGSEGPESNRSEEPVRRENTSLLKEGSESQSPASLEHTEVTQGQPQMREGMEPERTAPGSSADLGLAAGTAAATASHKHGSTMQDVLSEIQSLVERSNIINRTPHIDLNWYLKSSPGEQEIRLVRTVQWVLACRYQPAELDVTAMAQQLEEAEGYRSCVQEQVATMKSTSAAKDCDPNALRRAEGQWRAALLDASATVQVKAAQLDQVKQYHRQMKLTRAFLEVLAAEREKMSLNALGSSAVQADKLQALLQTMEQKKSIMEELLHLSSQMSVHLSYAESSGALLAQLGDVQEQWRLLEASIKRALEHAANSTSQSSVLVKEAEQLKAKLEDLQSSDFENNDSKSDLESVCLTTDLKLYHQLYLHLQSQSEALVHFSLGQKEKDKVQNHLQELGSLLDVTKKKLHDSTCGCGDVSSAKINKQLKDLIVWAKQAENHISTGKKLALFPEEARVQIADMKKFQTGILSRRSKMRVQVEGMTGVASDMEKEESDQVLKTIEDLYEAIADSLDHVLDTMKKHLQKREKLLSQLASMDAWLAESHATRDACAHVENVSKADVQKLESELRSHKLAAAEIRSRLKLAEAMAEGCKDITVGLSPGESRYLVNRLSGLWTELDGLLAHENATSWELEELIHERTSSDEELSIIQTSLEKISIDLEQQRFPLTQETLSMVAHLTHVLVENRCQAQELQHCNEAKRSALLHTIGELQDKCKALSRSAFEQDKYLHLRRQMEESRDIAKEQIRRAREKSVSVGERFRLCQTLLVELPLVKTQCQEAGDQLEALAQELYPSQLHAERQRIRHTVETLVSMENSVTDDIINMEAKLLLGLRFSSELPALMELFRRTRAELEGAEPVDPDEKAIDGALRRYWVIWRNMKSGMRVVEALGRKQKVNLKDYEELHSLRDAAMQECHLGMESLSQARESLKDYQWAAQGAIAYLHNAEATFLSALGGFLDCTEEQRQTQQALEALEEGFQAHISHLVELLPQQPCLSHRKVEELHISILSQLLVGRAVLEAQAQLRLESLQRCAVRQQSHRSCHEDVRQRLSGFEARLSECAAVQVTSYDKCVAQQKRARLLMDDLCSLAGKIEDLRAACPMQGCGVGKDGELGALWRRWVALRRGVGLLMAHVEQRQEEWKDITTSMQQCCSFLASLQAEVPDSSTVSFAQEIPQELLAQAEIHQAGLEQEQQDLASLEHRLEHALSLSNSLEPVSPGPVGKTLVKIQENVRSLKERNLMIVAAAQAEEKEREQVLEEIEEVEKHVFAIVPKLEACWNPSQGQELRKALSSQKAKLECIVDGVQSRYAEIPADIGKRLQEVQQRVEELVKGSDPVRKLAGRVVELGSGLQKVTALLEQKSPTVGEAQNVLKRVWDELDTWHSRLMLLESEMQDLAEEQPDQAHALMDHIAQPLQLHQNASQMAEYRTAFLSKIPACLRQFEDISYSATCWLDEAQSWLSAACSFTTARSLQNHANSLQLVLDDSARIRDMLQDFRPVLAEISAVCDVGTQEKTLDHNDQRVHQMQRNLLEPLEQLLQAAVAVEAMEAEVKTMEKNVPKIRTILSSMDDTNITLAEHLHNREVILANVQSIRTTLEEMEKCKGELPLPQGAEESLLVFSRARLLLQPLEELGKLTQYQASLLENKIAMEEETRKNLGIAAVSNFAEEIQQQVQEPCEVSNSEEEEDEEGESCHSSSSDTLTCSIPEDPEEMLVTSDVASEDVTDVKPLKELQSSAHQFSPEAETSSKRAESALFSAEPGSDSNHFASESDETGLRAMDSEADVGDSSRPETLTAERPITAVTPAAGDRCATADTTDRHESAKHETFDALDPRTKSPQAAAAVEETRLVPARPVAPFTSTRESLESIREDEDDPASSTAPHRDVDTLSKEHCEAGSGHDGWDQSQQAQESSKVPSSSSGHEGDEKEQQRWSRLYARISEKLTALKRVEELHRTSTRSEDGGVMEKAPEKQLISTGSAPAVLQRTHESITLLRRIVKSADGSHPGGGEGTYEALRSVLLCLDAWTDRPDGAGEDEPQLRLLQEECVSTELTTVAGLLNKVQSESEEEADARHCLACLRDCLCTVQLLFTSSHDRLAERLGLRNQHQFHNQLCILDEFDLGQRETFPSLKDAPSWERRVLGRHLRESPGEKAKLQRASWASLQGITHLLELGEGCIKERQMSQVHSRGQLQAALCRHKKLLQVLGSQLAFVQHLFRREEPAMPESQEDERSRLEVRAKALQQQALGREAASQRRLQEWTLWEDRCSRLGRVLDESEALISSGEAQGDADEEEEVVVQRRLEACQRTLVQLDESRAALGLLLDQRELLQTEPAFAAAVGQTGGALELRWRSASRRTEQEIQRCGDIQVARARFQTNSASVSNWLVGANKRLESWSDPNRECDRSSIIELLDFSMETEAMSAQRASVSSDATRLLHLWEADRPELRAQIAELEVNWSRHTSDLSKTQEQLHQRLLAGWPPAELLSDLETWLKKQEASLGREEETFLEAEDAAQIAEVLQHYRELKAGIVSGQLLVDFLCQSRPQAAGADVLALQSERTMFAETLGDLRLRWLHLQGELESQIRGAEQTRRTCAVRERRLQHLRGWIAQQKEQLSRWEQPASRTRARGALREWEAVVGRGEEVAAALQRLKAAQVHAGSEEERPCDVAFSSQAEGVSRACEDLSQQMEALRPALQQTVEQWSRFHGDLREVSLQASELRCALQHQRAPLFSLEQAEGYVDLLREIQGKAEKGEELWAAVEKSFPSLVKTLHCGAAQAMGEQVEAEQKRWKNATQELKDERVKAGETVSLWQEHSRLCENSSLHLRRLWLQWEELLSSSRSRDRDTQALIQSVEKLQDVAENLQSGVNDALEASKPLIGRLAPLAANLIQSEIRLLSRDLLLLTRAMSGKKKSLQEDLEDQKLFHTCLQSLEKQTQNIKDKLKAGSEDQDSVKVLLELGDLFPPLVDVREMSSYLTLDNRDAERLRALSSEWVEGVTRTSDMNRELQAERQSHQTFQEKCDNLTHLKEKLAEESRKAESPSSLQEILTVQQRLQADMITGHQLLQGLLCDAVTSMEKETGEKRSELVARVSSVREGWFSAVALAGRCRSVAKEQLRQRRIYNHGLKLLWKLLRDVGPLLPPAGTALCTPQQLRSCADDYQCVQGALDLHSAVYRQTLEAGQRLCETMRESEWRSRLQSELRAIGEAWKGTTSRLERRRDLHHSAVQKWSRCQDGIASIACDLDEVKTRMLERPEDSEKLIQETELSLQRLASGLRELRTMKTDLSQYITAGDSALLEQQLEQLHGQWEELCMKVSLRKQEIADRLNAWTIFNDKNREFCDWLAQMESKVCRSADLSIEEMVEKLKKDCMEEINLFSENKSHLKQLGEQLLLASDEAKRTQVGGSLREVNQRWHNLFRHIEARVKKLTETLVTVQQLDKNMSNLRSWLSRIEAELSRPITYSVCHHQEIQRRLAEQQELQRDIEQHTEGVASVLGLCDVLLRDEDAAGAAEAEGDSLQETSRSLDQRWRTICSLALDRRLRIEETWRLWCKFLEDYSRFEDWLKMAERTAANPNSAGVLYTAAKEELKKFEGFQRQVHERLTQLEIVNNQYRRLARENRTDRASQLKVMVHEGNRRWDVLHRRVAAILRRLKYFTSQREEFEGTRESMLVWLTELDLQLTNVEHFSESDVHHKMRQLNSFQKEITLNTERIDGLIVFGEGLIQRSSPQDAALIEDELEELHAYCQEVFSRLVRFHQRLSQPPVREEPELSGATFSLESSLELIDRPWLGRGNFSLPATPTHLLASPLERSGRETPVSVDSLPLEWDHTGDVGASSSHEDEDDEEEEEEEEEEQQEGEEGVYFSALSVPSRSVVVHESPVWDADTPPLLLPPGDHTGAAPPLTSTPRKKSYLGLMSQCSGSIEDIKRVSLILDDDGEQRRQQQELGLTGLTASDKQSGVIERWELLQAQARSPRPGGPQGPDRLRSELDDLASWLASVSPELERLQRSKPAASVADMEAGARELKEMQRMFTQHKSTMLSVNLRAPEAPELQPRLTGVNRDWSRVCTGLQRWDASLRKTLLRCREFHETLHSLLLWLAHAESRRYAVDIGRRDTPVRALQQHRNTLAGLREELRGRQAQQASLQALWSQLRPEGGGDHGGEDGDDGERSDEAQEKLHVTGSKLKLLLRDVDLDLSGLQQRLNGEPASDVPDQSVSADCSRDAARARTGSSVAREKRESSPPRSFFHRVLRAAFPLHLLLLLVLLLPCLIPLTDGDPGCSVANNFASSFYPMLHYTNGPPPT